MALLQRFSDAERDRLRSLAVEFLRQKSLEPAAGARLDDELRPLIATQACVPVLELGLEWYDDWKSVIVYPGDFIAEHEFTDEAGVVHREARALAGEAWDRGPVLLSLDGVLEGARGDYVGNLVIHELAHKLDMRNGAANGMPPLHRGMDRARWTRALSTAFDDFRSRAGSGAAHVMDDYAAEDPAEFFAVASELFFVRPDGLASRYPDVYHELRLFFRQDPAAPDAG
jgi:Mlc titration factor MtfA (ptsG expression regulator)